jgi:hypothetical protein
VYEYHFFVAVLGAPGVNESLDYARSVSAVAELSTVCSSLIRLFCVGLSLSVGSIYLSVSMFDSVLCLRLVCLLFAVSSFSLGQHHHVQMELAVLQQCHALLEQVEAKLVRKRSVLVQLKQQRDKEGQGA